MCYPERCRDMKKVSYCFRQRQFNSIVAKRFFPSSFSSLETFCFQSNYIKRPRTRVEPSFNTRLAPDYTQIKSSFPWPNRRNVSVDMPAVLKCWSNQSKIEFKMLTIVYLFLFHKFRWMCLASPSPPPTKKKLFINLFYFNNTKDCVPVGQKDSFFPLL